MVRKRVAVIGSRETPDYINKLIKQFTNMLVEGGYAISSGGCPEGPDKAAYDAVMGHKNTDRSKHRIYISWEGMAGLKHDPANGVYDAQQFENYPVAGMIGKIARGSWEGLGKGGIAHHSRNPYQVLWDDLCSLVDFVVCYAIPVGKQGRVKGGTATAVRIAKEHGIPVYNLHDPEVLARVESFVISVIATRRSQCKS